MREKKTQQLGGGNGIEWNGWMDGCDIFYSFINWHEFGVYSSQKVRLLH